MTRKRKPARRARKVVTCDRCGAVEPLRYPLVLLFAISQHVWWAAMLWLDARAGDVTALATMQRLLGSRVLEIAVLILVSLAAILALFWRRPGAGRLLLLLPQQFLLVVSACGAVGAMASRSFPDGVERSFAFIAADQGSHIMMALLHTFVISRLWTRPSR